MEFIQMLLVLPCALILVYVPSTRGVPPEKLPFDLGGLVREPAAEVVRHRWDNGHREQFRTLDFSVIGQAKCGTSSLWRYLTSHPNIAAPKRKEIFHFVLKCHTASVLRFYDGIAPLLTQELGADTLLGDFTAAYMSCPCCPDILQTLNPRLKLIVSLRHPISRALSRFQEIKHYKRKVYPPEATFQEITLRALDTIERCLMRSSMRFKTSVLPGAGASVRAQRPDSVLRAYHDVESEQPDNTTFAGIWSSRRAAQPRLYHLAKVQCAVLDPCIGYSMYDIFIEHYLQYFPPSQLKVVHMDQLDEDPLTVLRELETFLGLPHHEYDPNLLSLRFHTADCKGWLAGCNSTSHDKTLAKAKGLLGDEVYERLRRFFRPGLQQMKRLQALGSLKSIPDSYFS